MKVIDKLYMTKEQLIENGPITIVVFGDSITHGAFAPGDLDSDCAYWSILRKKLIQVRNYVPINMINAGIGGITAKDSIERMDKQVLLHKPDLIIVCFGLNDVNGSLEDYLDSLRTIFTKCSVTETVFMTPNMLNTYVAEDTDPALKEYAAVTAQFQNNGKMDLLMQSAVELAREMHIPVCDCYAKWKKISETEDTTLLLANRINHPTKEMHTLFAESLFEILNS